MLAGGVGRAGHGLIEVQGPTCRRGLRGHVGSGLLAGKCGARAGAGTGAGGLGWGGQGKEQGRRVQQEFKQIAVFKF